MIEQHSIEHLKNIVNIVDIVSDYVELKKSGANYKGCCPFHSENTPSFVASPSKNIYHCFGCGVGGDGINFVKEIEKISYPEAIEKVATKYNFQLEYSNKEFKKVNTKLLEVVNQFFKSKLERNEIAKEYLKNRGLFTSTIEKFELGYAGSSKELLDFLTISNLSTDEAIELGVIGNDEFGRLYSRFIERIIFPIKSSNGNIIGFGGRTISNHPAKYLNSPQTKLFNKSKIFYAFNLAKDEIFKKKEIIVTEGYLDVIMLHQAGFKNVVATLGTALTTEHLPQLSKSDLKVILAYDGDNAGLNAGIRASKLLLNHSFNGGVVIFRDGLDPADMVLNNKTKELEELLFSPTPFAKFILDFILNQYNIKIPEQKELAFKEALTFLNSLSPILQEEYQTYLSNKLMINSKIIKFSNKPKQNITNYNKNLDLAELRVIKTIIEYPKYFDFVLEFIDSEAFIKHSHEFELLKIEDLNSKAIREIILNENIIPLSENELKEQIKILKIINHNRNIEKLKRDSSLNMNEKLFLIKKEHNSIYSLQKHGLI